MKLTAYMFCFTIFSLSVSSQNLMIKEAPVVEHKIVKIRDIADAGKIKQSDWKRISDENIAVFSLSREKMVIPGSRILTFAREYNVSFNNYGNVLIKRNVKDLEDSFFKNRITETIAEKLKDFNPDVTVHSLNIRDDISIPDNSDIAVTKVSNRAFCGRVSFTFSVIERDTGKTIRFINCYARISLNLTVPVVAENSQKGDPLSGIRIVREEKSFTHLNSLPVIVKDAANYELSTHVRAGEVLTEDKIQKLTIVRNREQVSVVLKQGMMEIEMTGVALEDGSEGDMIRILNTDSNRVLKAKVIGKQMTQII